MKFIDIFNNKNKCLHGKVPYDAEIYYCPDCGELIENRWYIVRCSCCGTKEIATIRNGEIIPEENFCHNCGNKGYIVERIDKIDCININYAVLVKEVLNNQINEYTQSWIDTTQTANCTQKLLQ